MMSKVGLYARLSIEDSNSLSCQNQIEQLKEFCFSKNYKELEVYIDDGYSGKNMERPALQKLISDMAKGYIDTIIVKDLSRFSRNLLDAMYFIEEIFKKNNIRFISLNDHYDSFLENDEYDVVIRCFINDYYIKDCSKKIKAVISNKSSRQSLSTGFYGYVLDKDKKLVIHEEQAKIVRYIYNEYIQGESIEKIIEYFNAYNVPSPKTVKYKVPYPWTKQSVHKIVSNKEYTGIAINYKTVNINYKQLKNVETLIIENDHPPIVTKEEFAMAEARRNKQTALTSKKYNIEKLCGLIFCEKCNRGMRFSYEKKGNEFLYQTYTCPLCKNKIRANQLYTILEKDIKNTIKKVQKYLKEDLLKKRLKSSNCDFEKKLQVIKASYKTIFENYMFGKIDQESYKNQIEDVKQKEKILNEKIAENIRRKKDDEQMMQEYKLFIKDIKKYTQLSQVEYIKKFIEKIYLRDNYLNIMYKYHF